MAKAPPLLVTSAPPDAQGLPPAAGLGLRLEHAPFWLTDLSGADTAPAFAEIHAENFMMAGGPQLRLLDEVAERHPVSVHGVALSLAGPERLDRAHLAALKRLLTRCRAASFSEHLAWSSLAGTYYNDLLPIVRISVQ